MLDEIGKINKAKEKADNVLIDKTTKMNDMKAILEELDGIVRERNKNKENNEKNNNNKDR